MSRTIKKYPLFHKFLMQVTVRSSYECWDWNGYKNRNGYGEINTGKRKSGSYKSEGASRVAYRLYKGEIGGLHVCHHCDNPGCVNPDHLFLGTHQDNMNDMVSKGRGIQARRKSQTHCIRGHALIEENLQKRSDTDRVCKLCHSERNQKYRLKIKKRKNEQRSTNTKTR